MQPQPIDTLAAGPAWLRYTLWLALAVACAVLWVLEHPAC